MLAEPAARAHRGEELAELGDERGGAGVGGGDQLGEQAVGEQADILGEEAEEQADQEVGDALGLLAVAAQQRGELGEVAGGLLRDLLGGLGGAERLGVGEEVAQPLEALGGKQVVEGDRGDLLDGVGEVGVDDDAVDVADHEERRVLEALAVLEELLVGAGEVGVLALVLPGEAAALPDIGPALAAALAISTRLEGEAGARRVVLLGGGVFQV